MASARDIETAILDELHEDGPCSMDELVRRLPSFTWNQVFSVLDQMSRQGDVLIRSRRRFEYEVCASTHRLPAA